MASLNFVISADNKPFIAAMQESMSAVKNAAQTMEGIGALLDMQEFREAAASVSDFATKFYEASQESVSNLSTMASEFSQQAANIRRSMESMSEGGGTDEMSGQLKEYQQAVMDAAAAAQTAYNLQGVAVSSLTDELGTLQQAQEAAFTAGDSSTAAELQGQIDSLSSTLEQAQQRFNELGQQADAANQQLNSLDATIQQFGGGAESLGSIWGNLKDRINEATQATTNWLTGNGKFTEGLQAAKGALSSMGGAFAPAIAGAKQMITAMRAMIATPIGAVLTAVVVALQAIHKWFTKSAAGQRAFAKISAYVGSILDTLSDILVKVGSYLYHAFADATGPLNAFAKSLVGTFSNAIKSVYHLVKGFADSMSGLWQVITGDGEGGRSGGWERVKAAGATLTQAFKEIGATASNAFSTIGNGFKGLGQIFSDGFGSFSLQGLADGFKSMFSTAQRASELAGENIDQQVALSEAQARQAELDKKIGEQYEKLYKLKGKEKQDAINELKELQKAKYDDIIKAQTALYNIRKKTNDLHSSTLEDLQAERDLRVQMLQSEAARANATRMLSRLEASNERQMAASASRSSKATAKDMATTARNAEALAKAEAKLDELNRNNTIARADAQVELEERIAEARIAAMQEGGEKIAAERDRQNRQELLEIAAQQKAAVEAERNRQRAEYEAQQEVIKAQGGTYTKWDEAMLDQDALKAISDRYEELANLVKKRQEQVLMQSQSEAMRTFLKQFGDYQQQRLAIAEEYADKIAKAQSEGERQSLRQQEQDAASKLAFQRFKDSINWEEVFGDIDALSLEHLESLNGQLKKLLDDATLSATDYKTVCDQINRVEAEIIERQNEWKKGLGLTINELERRKRLQQEAARAQAELATAEQRYQQAVEQANNIRQAIKLTTGIEIDAKDITLENADEILAKFDPSSTAWKVLRSMFDTLADSDRELKEATTGLDKATGKAAATADKAKTSFSDALNLINEISAKVNANIQSMTDLVGALGIEDTAFGKGVTEFATAAQSATDAFSDLQSGNYIGALANSLKSLGSLGNALGSLGIAGMGDSDKTLAKDMERLTASNEALKRSVDDLTDEMGDAAFSDVETIYKQLQANLEQSQRNTQEMMRRTGAAYNNGFLGIGGSSSSNSKINGGVTASEWQRISAIVGRSVTSAGQFWSLTSEQMHKVAKDAPDVYAHIKQLAADGYKDASQYMDDYIEYWRELEEAANAYAEKLTGISFDDVESEFKSMLSDFDSSSEDFAENFEKYLQNAIIGALVADQYKPMLDRWYQNFRKAAETDGIDKAEQDALRREWDDITQQALRDREQLREQFGWGSTGEGSGAYKAVASFSQEQGDELNGRLTALQIGQERNNQSLLLAVTQLQQLSVVITANGTALSEMRNLMLIGNGHLEDIARYTRIASQFGDAINTIADKIKTL